MRDIKVTAAAWSFHDQRNAGKCDIFHYLDLIKYRYHMDTADIWNGFIRDNIYDDAYVALVADAIKSKSLTLANICVDGPYLWCDSAEEREAHKKEMLRYIDVAEKLGAKTIRVDFGGPKGRTEHDMPEEAFDYIVKTYKEYCHICGDKGMRIGPENHWGWDLFPEYLEKVRDAVDDPAYGHLYHIDHFTDEPERGEEICMSYAMHVHIPPAPTVAKSKEVIRKMENLGYQGAYSVEYYSGGPMELERIEWHVATVREFIAELKYEGFDKPVESDYIHRLFEGKEI